MGYHPHRAVCGGRGKLVTQSPRPAQNANRGYPGKTRNKFSFWAKWRSQRLTKQSILSQVESLNLEQRNTPVRLTSIASCVVPANPVQVGDEMFILYSGANTGNGLYTVVESQGVKRPAKKAKRICLSSSWVPASSKDTPAGSCRFAFSST